MENKKPFSRLLLTLLVITNFILIALVGWFIFRYSTFYSALPNKADGSSYFLADSDQKCGDMSRRMRSWFGIGK